MGKRQIGQLQPFELVVILIISEMATIGVQNNGTPLLNSLLPIITITVLQIAIALINLKSEKFRLLVCGRPQLCNSRRRDFGGANAPPAPEHQRLAGATAG